METNKKRCDELQSELYSQVKDGQPKTLIQKIIGYGYPIMLVFISLVSIIGTVKSKWNWKIFFPIFLICTISGWFWGIYIETYDPNFPGWLFLPWSITNIEFILTLEDWLFYPVCTLLFFFVFVSIKRTANDSKFSHKLICQFFHIVLTFFFCYFSAVCGQSLCYQCAIPAIILFFYAWDNWNVKHYLKFISLLVIFEIFWDYFAVSWLSYIPGMSWASQWVYITFDVQNNYLHSSVFLDYSKFKWAWIFKNPIEITPWFGIAVCMYFYALYISYEKFTKRNTCV